MIGRVLIWQDAITAQKGEWIFDMHGIQTMTRTIPPPSQIQGRGWHVLQVWSGQEWNVQRAIGDRFNTYLPLETVHATIRGRKLKKLRSYFPGYLSVELDRNTDDWGRLEREDGRGGGLRGSMGFLKNNGKLSVVPDKFIEALKRMEEAGVFDHTIKSAFNPGDIVRVRDYGSLTDKILKIIKSTPRKRSKGLMDLLGGQVEVEISDEYLEKVS